MTKQISRTTRSSRVVSFKRMLNTFQSTQLKHGPNNITRVFSYKRFCAFRFGVARCGDVCSMLVCEQWRRYRQPFSALSHPPSYLVHPFDPTKAHTKNTPPISHTHDVWDHQQHRTAATTTHGEHTLLVQLLWNRVKSVFWDAAKHLVIMLLPLPMLLRLLVRVRLCADFVEKINVSFTCVNLSYIRTILCHKSGGGDVWRR